ncbi:MAG: prepilin-type N-terminal cleavage/methylation domain-containing protein [Myxococcota bacterium]
MRRGFTAIELAVCLSISAVLAPAVWLFSRSLHAPVARGQWYLESAATVRAVAEQLALDQAPACHARYALEEGDLVRVADASCGGRLVLARGVQRFERVTGGVELTLALRLRPDQVHEKTIFIPLEAP